MLKNIILILFFLFSVPAVAAVTLQCDASKLCDAYFKNCSNSSYKFSIFIDPQDKIVIFGSTKIQADFSNPAEVSFKHVDYTFYINKHEYSATLANSTEVRSGLCKKVEPAW
ncbi:hypothetical protein [Vibrio breoganii]|uniref:hypothetical protein n=1 Tax=Vibrio breoganii TaxID=553239 RepID=UPI000C845679|nr:hypothetical protein [Vibrio breoganii]PML91943.1 hypothetical protein BCT64_17035 [Vibrio breoganii]PMN64244.1 hypothetical protein BCT28_08430 [Vibrio breoganii]